MTEYKEPCGVLLLDKPAGKTSHDMVGLARRLYGLRRVGHTGTLDPLATGVLVILIGRAAKAAEYLSVHDKCYVATLRLGQTTTTEDITGTVLTSTEILPDAAAVKQAAKRYRGEYLQTPPMYSALKVGGKKLLDLAREGITVERTARPVQIHGLTVRETDKKDEYTLDVHCSAGTYIRTLCADMGRDLGCGGVMATLRRTKTGRFAIADCVTPEALAAMSMEERLSLLRPVEALFEDLPAVTLPPFYERLARCGCEIYQKKIGNTAEVGTRFRLLGENGTFFALGEVQAFEEGNAIKPIKQFEV